MREAAERMPIADNRSISAGRHARDPALPARGFGISVATLETRMADRSCHRRPVVEGLETRALLSALPVVPGEVTVAGRHVFYNHSALDGRSARADARDDAAVAPDKAALLPGEAISAANYTSYSRGINGVMVDLSGLPADATVSAGDFEFRLGNDADPSGWKPAPAPRAVVVRRLPRAEAEEAEVARVTVVWRDRLIRNAWLQVTLLANTDTGLAAPDVFYVGNLVGDAEQAGGASGARVDPADVSLVQASVSPAPPANAAADVDHNGRVNRADVRAARRNLGAELFATAPFPADVSVPP